MFRRLSTIVPFAVIVLLAAIAGCGRSERPDSGLPAPAADPSTYRSKVEPIENPLRVIHVLVALCDNEHQGIVPVPAHLGDGNDPDRNLYWGAAYGVATYFGKSPDWKRVGEIRDPKSDILRRLIFRHRSGNAMMFADAYRGDRISAAMVDFLAASSGSLRLNVDVNGTTFQIYGGADLIAFVGHNGLMDLKINESFPASDDRKRDAIVLACASRQYFRSKLRETGANPLLWTTNLMAPEAYVLHDAIEGWIAGENGENVRLRASRAYSKYQNIGLRSAESLFVTGWD